jgi:hypothetical protein
MDVSGLDGETGFVIVGASDFDYSGLSVASAGDINGDGFDDVIIVHRHDRQLVQHARTRVAEAAE